MLPIRRSVEEYGKSAQNNYNNNLCGTEVLLEVMVAHGINKMYFHQQQPHTENRNGFRFLKQTARFQQTVMEKQNFPWKDV